MQIDKLNLVLDPNEPEVVMDRKTFLLMFDEYIFSPRVPLENKIDKVVSVLRTAQTEEAFISLLGFHLHKCKLALVVREAINQNPDFFEEEWK